MKAFLLPQVSRLSRSAARAFTLVEILVSLAVLAILLMISAEVIGTVQTTWTSTNARVSQFREARTAFDIITRNLSQATLNTYLDYDNNYLTSADPAAATSTAPSRYVRKSDLRFVCGPAAELVPSGGGAGILPGQAVFFQAPLGVAHDPTFAGLDRLLCGRGYFVQFTSDEFFRPQFIASGNLRFRYRLMEYSPPAEQNLIYSDPATKAAWMNRAGIPLQRGETALNRSLTRPVADNIVALVISPMIDIDPNAGAAAGNGRLRSSTQIAENFRYDSERVNLQNQLGLGPQGTQYLLPPLVRVVLVAIDETSADRLAQTSGNAGTAPFGTQINDLINSRPASQLNQTLEDVGRILREQYRVNYRIFSATVSLRGAKWST
jgi:uncharacterized protein (TIGR02599 family)